MPQPVHLHVSSRDERLLASLLSRRIHPSLHYETDEQAQKWLALHRRHSPAANTPDTIQLYAEATRHIASRMTPGPVEVVSLGCGGGNKDLPLLESLLHRGCVPRYIPCDISERLAGEASSNVAKLGPLVECAPVLCDLERSAELAAFLDARPHAPRIILFFGILPNMEPATATKCLRPLLRLGDRLLLSANLASDPRDALPQYNNPETRDWLLTLLHDLGVADDAGALRFEIQAVDGLPRITAIHEFQKAIPVVTQGSKVEFRDGDTLRLFFSNRHTPQLVHVWMRDFGLTGIEEWINARGDEGIFAGVRTS